MEQHILSNATQLHIDYALVEDLSWESMALKAVKIINNRLRFLYRKNKFLLHPPRRLLCNAISQPYFNYVWLALYPDLSESLKTNE